MERHFELNDNEFELQFASCELNPSFFSHEAHLRLAWIHIKNYGLTAAESNIQLQLKNYVVSLGAFDKYNATLTVAAIRAVDHFMRKSKSQSFGEFIEEFPRLKYNFRELMNTHYGFDIYLSGNAKSEFIEPDLLPFD